MKRMVIIMKRTIKTIATVATVEIMLVCAYLLGTTQAETVTEIREIEKTVEVVPNGYIDTTSEEFQKELCRHTESCIFRSRGRIAIVL